MTTAEARRLHRGATMSLDRFRTSVVTATGQESVAYVARAMRDGGVGCVVVVHDGHARAVLTDRDLVVRVVAAGRDPTATRVEDIATYDPVTVSVDEGIETAASRMRAHGIRRLPVVDAGGRVVGIVTADDLLVLLGCELARVCEAIADRSDASDSR